MSDITSIAPYEPVTIQDTTDENRTDLVALLQRQENEIALQNQVIRQFLEHWDSISQRISCSKGGYLRCIRRGTTVMFNAEGVVSSTDGVVLCTIPNSFVPANDVIISRGGSPEQKIVAAASGKLLANGAAANGVEFWNTGVGVAKN